MLVFLFCGLFLKGELLSTASRMDLNQARTLLAEGTDANQPNPNGETPLMIAAQTGYLDMVNLFLENGGRTEAFSNRGETALFFALRHGRLEILRRLIEAKSPLKTRLRTGESPLSVAVARGDHAATSVLLKAGADPNAANLYGENILFSAILSGDDQMVAMLTQAGADLSFKTKSRPNPTKLARQLNNPKIQAILKADPSKPSKLLSQAIIDGNLDQIKILITQDINMADENGNTPLMLAARMGSPAVAAYLVEEMSASVDSPGHGGRTPLMEAVHRGRIAMVTWLLARGANANAVTTQGNATPISLAYANRDMVTLNFLIGYKGRLITMDPNGDQVSLPYRKVNTQIIGEAVTKYKPVYPLDKILSAGGVQTEGDAKVESPQFTQKTKPKFPSAPTGLRLPTTAEVELQAVFQTDGSISQIRVVKPAYGGILGFEYQAILALKRWKFRSGTLAGKPASVRSTVTVQFLTNR